MGLVTGVLLCYELKVRATTNQFFFAGKEWPEKTQNAVSISTWPGAEPKVNRKYG